MVKIKAAPDTSVHLSVSFFVGGGEKSSGVSLASQTLFS